ncbi:MAG: P22 phage major capsid protein family protein [Pseudomonadota bacterium]|uniref:Putative capsid protein n=1 Tax=viral metagenome TaxID=1070528 RepID=A0A6M3LMJ6_9ZZZZ
MANTLTVLVPKLLAGGLRTLRQNAITYRLVQTGYTLTPQTKGKTITIPLGATQARAAVVPAATPPANIDHTPTSVELVLDQWYKSDFHLSDQDMSQIDAQTNFIPKQSEEAVKVLANGLDTDLLGLYKSVYQFAGTAGTTPFANDARTWTTGARKILNDSLAPVGDRSVVLDTDAEANAIDLEEFQNAAWSGSDRGIVEGEIGRKLGAGWYMNQNVPTHTKGTLAAGTALQLNAEVAAGATTAVFKDSGGTLTGTMTEGDLFTIAGHAQQYTCSALATAAANLVTVTFTPAAATTYTISSVVTHIDGHVASLGFHRDAFAIGFAPLADDSMGLARQFMIQDPLTGIVLRLEVTREYKQVTWRYDILYGVKAIRPELACRILG